MAKSECKSDSMSVSLYNAAADTVAPGCKALDRLRTSLSGIYDISSNGGQGFTADDPVTSVAPSRDGCCEVNKVRILGMLGSRVAPPDRLLNKGLKPGQILDSLQETIAPPYSSGTHAVDLVDKNFDSDRTSQSESSVDEKLPGTNGGTAAKNDRAASEICRFMSKRQHTEMGGSVAGVASCDHHLHDLHVRKMVALSIVRFLPCIDGLMSVIRS